jgi:hypothetical protein
MADQAALGVSEVHLMPTGDPVEFVRNLGEHVVAGVTEL